jgi:hypothetical protein
MFLNSCIIILINLPKIYFADGTTYVIISNTNSICSVGELLEI